jgi:hypothetical protein
MTCTRSWSVEAARDGRLVGSEASTVERHIATCPSCAAESKRLEALGRALRRLPVSEPDPLTARREKQRLLAAADASLVAPQRRRWVPLVAIATVLAAAAGVLAWRAHRASAPSSALAASVTPGDGARWSRTEDGHRETITLDEGSLALHVRHASPEDRVVVLVPDGEIEDRGTVFSVDVSQHHTTRVSVEEGSVTFRRAGQPPVFLEKGQSWSDKELMLAAAPNAVAPSREVAPSDSPTRAPAPTEPARESVEAPSAPRAASPSRARPATPSPRVAASSEFRAGFLAIEEGNNGDATKHLSSELDAAKDASRAEDAAYLRIIALARANARDKARALAREYLRTFPRGFRRAEVEEIAR